MFFFQNRRQSESSDQTDNLEVRNLENGPSISGFSFMEPGSTVIFSKEDDV